MTDMDTSGIGAIGYCPNVKLRIVNAFNRPLCNLRVAIETGTRKPLTTNTFGEVEYYEETFSNDGFIFLEYGDGSKHLSWSVKLPTEPGNYTLPLNIWTNDIEGSE